MNSSPHARPATRPFRATFPLIATALTLATVAPVAWLGRGTPPAEPESPRALARKYVIEKLKTKQTKPFDKPAEALDFFWSKRSPTGEAMDRAPLEAAAEAAAELPVHTTLPGAGGAGHTTTAPLGTATDAGSASGTVGGWQPLGPGNIGGRSRALLIHRTQNNLMWTAGVAGGIWKSTDAGETWRPTGDLLVNIAVNSIIQDPAQDNVLYAGTGEGFFNGDAVRGQGIFKSTDYGETWRQLAATDNANFFYVQKLAATRHKKKQRIYAATRTGIFRSTDGGATWTQVLAAANVNGCMDLAIQHYQEDQQNYVFASCGTFAQATVYRALDADGLPAWEVALREPLMGRTSLAVSPSNPTIVYALASYFDPGPTPNGQLQYGMRAVYRSDASGAPATWTTQVDYTTTNKLNRVQLTNPVYAFFNSCFGSGPDQYFTQGWYDNQIAVDPKNPDIVWTAGIDLMRSDDGGRNWGLASYWWFGADDPNYAHADNHAITFHPKYNGDSNRQMFAASDGGIHRTDDARAGLGTTLEQICGLTTPDQIRWRSLNNAYQVTQFYHGAVYPDGRTFFGGTQDNGTLRGSTADGQNWEGIRGGDGGYVAVDKADTNVLYGEYTGKSLERSVNGGVSWTPIHGGVPEAAGNFQFIHPFAMDPNNSSRLWYGGARAFRSDNRGTTWVLASQFFASRIASWGILATDSDRVFAGVQHLGTTTSGLIFNTRIATTATNTTVWQVSQPRQGYVSSIAVASTEVAYATYSTYNFGTHLGHVFKTVDGGATWTRIDATLPDMPVHSIVVHPSQPDTLYIGTDLGVFVTINGGDTWMRENTGFANVVTEHLEINNGRLFAFTHGRSVWSVPLQ